MLEILPNVDALPAKLNRHNLLSVPQSTRFAACFIISTVGMPSTGFTHMNFFGHLQNMHG
jgi:hypothetical protein